MPKRTFTVIDCSGLHVDTARKLGQEGHKVYYYKPWQSVYPKFESYGPGVGIPEITKVEDFGPYLDESDCIIFPYVGMGELAHFLRDKGYTVLGAGRGEVLEQDRIKSCEIMQKLGMKYPETQGFTGIDAALEFFKNIFAQKQETNQNATGKYFVKFNKFRGDIDSFPVASYEEAEFMLGEVRANFGPYSSQIPVIVQKTVEGIECGADLFFNGDRFITPGMWGFESSDNYVGQMVSDLSIFKNDLDRISKYLREVNYRGPFSFEAIYDGQDCHWIDITCRWPMPLGLMYAAFIPDFGEFILGLAAGTVDTFPIEEGRFIGGMSVSSEEALNRYIPLKGGNNTKFMHYMMNGGKSYSVPGISCVGMVCGEGDSMEEVESAIGKESESISVFFGSFQKKFIDDIKKKYIEPLENMGVQFIKERPVKQPAPKPAIPKPKQDTDRWGIPDEVV